MKGDEPVSMNLWGFTPAIVPVLTDAFAAFSAGDRIAAGEELFLPNVVGEHLRSAGGELHVTVLVSDDRCLGVTHPDDVPLLQADADRPRLVTRLVPIRTDRSSTGRVVVVDGGLVVVVDAFGAVVVVVGGCVVVVDAVVVVVVTFGSTVVGVVVVVGFAVAVVVDVGFVVAVVDVAGLAVVAVALARVAGGIDGGRANWAKPGCVLPLIVLNSPPTKTRSSPTATEYGPVGVFALGFQGSSRPVAASKAARWRRSVPFGQYW